MVQASNFAVRVLNGELLSREPVDFRERSAKLMRLPLTWLDGQTRVSFLIQEDQEDPYVKLRVFSSRPFEGVSYRPAMKVVDGEPFRPEVLIYNHQDSRPFGPEANRTFDIVNSTLAGGFHVLDQAGVQLAVGASLYLPKHTAEAVLAPTSHISAAAGL